MFFMGLQSKKHFVGFAISINILIFVAVIHQKLYF